MKSCLRQDQFEQINAVSRIALPEKFQTLASKYINLVELEHKALAHKLCIGEKAAKVWWENNPQWCGEVQRQQRFRKSPRDEGYYYWIIDEYSPPRWQWKNEHVRPAKFGDLPGASIDDIRNIDMENGNDFWFELDVRDIYKQLADDLSINTLEEVSQRFGEVRLVEWDNYDQEYKYHSNLGLFREIGGDR